MGSSLHVPEDVAARDARRLVHGRHTQTQRKKLLQNKQDILLLESDEPAAALIERMLDAQSSSFDVERVHDCLVRAASGPIRSPAPCATRSSAGAWRRRFRKASSATAPSRACPAR